MAIPNHTTVTARIGLMIADRADPGAEPDLLYADRGEIRLTPLIDGTKFDNGEAVIYLAQSEFVAEIDTGGHLSWNGLASMDLVDLTDERLDPHVEEDAATHTVSFKNIKAGGTPVNIPTRKVRITGDTVNLIELMPAEVAKGVFQVRGPAGADGDPGADSTVPGPPGAAGGTDAATAEWVQDGPLTSTALSAKIAGQAASKSIITDAVALGAPNDGVTNAQPALGAIHNTLPAAGGRILLRRGSYLMGTRLISTKQGMVIEGECPDATTLLIGTGAAFQVGCSDVLVKNLTLKGSGSNARQLFTLVTTGAFKNWRFENVKFDGVGAVVASIGALDVNGTALTLGSGHAGHVEFDNCEFLNYAEDGSLQVRGAKHVTVNRTWFHNLGTDQNKGDALKFSYGAEDWRALHCIFENLARDAIDCYDGQRGLVDGCNIINPGVHGVEMKVLTATSPNPADRNRIVNNHIVNAGSAPSAAPAIQCATSNAIISDNLIEGGAAGGIRGGKTVDGVSNNHDLIIMGNRVIGATGYGIFLGGIDRAAVIGNIVTGSTGAGFHVSSTVNSAIAGGAAMNVSANNGAADVWT